MSWLYYLLEGNLYLGIFYLCYCLFFDRETHYNLNRAYLLFSCVAAFVLPILQLGILIKPPPVAVTPISYTMPVNAKPIQITLLPPTEPQFTWQDGLVYTYYVGVIIFLLILLFKLFQLIQIARRGNTTHSADYKVVYLDDADTAFSFFKYLFIGTSPKLADTIIRHELVHIRQKHSADILFIELLKVINWFNPFIYLLQRSLRAVHEYIADEQTALAENGAIAYSSFLVDNAYGLNGTSVTHSFFNYNLLKKRIIMLHQKRSGKLARLKYLLIVPVCAGLLCASTLAFSKTYGWVDLAPRHTDTISKSKRYDVWNKSYDHIFTTSKGFKVHERVIFINGAVSKTADIFDKKGEKHFYDDRTISPKDCKFIQKEYGYQFPVDTVIKVKLLPPPPPAPPVRVVQFPRPTHPAQITKKGYHYAESGYLVNGKSDFRVIIIEKNGKQKDYWKSTASAADIKLLRDKYGYTFPEMPLYDKMPPPPPVPPVVRDETTPPPPAPPVNEKASPPASPASVTIKSQFKAKGLVYSHDINDTTTSNATPVILVNGEIYNLNKTLEKGQKLMVDARDSVHAVIYRGNDLQAAIKKYGENAKNGVIFAYGKTSVEIK